MIDSTLPKSKSQIIIEYILLAFCLCILALRTTFTEGPGALSPSLPSNVGDTAYSLSVSAVLIFSCVLWFIWSFCSNRFSYRATGIEVGLCLLCAASIAAGFAASDKRLAVTNVVMIFTPPLMAILLVQILNTQAKIKLVLIVIAALGVVSACQCAYQFIITNQVMIDQYEQAPQTLLEPLGIEPGGLQQFLFEHRLYTRGIRGFFTTRNSAGCFASMAAFAAFALFIERLNNHKEKPPVKPWAKNLNPYLLTGGAALTIIIVGLILTKSKGAIIGSLFTMILFIAYYYFEKQLKKHKKTILIACLLLVTLCGWLVISYGLKHNRLPGGSGMLVRWQYWQASGKMSADHPLTGVGPGNFTYFYPRYKPAEALESVADPHNFLLNILTQYGPIGLAGFLAMVLIPLWRVIFPTHIIEDRKQKTEDRKQKTEDRRQNNIIFLIVISAALLLVRPMILSEPTADTPELMIFVILTIYLAPVLAFIAGFLLLSAPLQSKRVTSDERRATKNIAILWCVILGVLLHNLIDYAIFEPGVYTTFWAIMACLIAIDNQQNQRPPIALKAKPPTKAIAAVVTLVVIGVYISFVWLPVSKSAAKIKNAYSALSAGNFARAHDYLTAAAEEDPLDATSLNLNGRLYLQHYSQTTVPASPQMQAGEKQLILLKKAEQCFRLAIYRNKANFKNYEKLSTVYELLGQTQKAYNWCFKAAKLYPNSGRLRFKLAKIAEQLSKTDIAIEQYRKTIEIEDSFRQQFKIMHPERLVSAKLRAVAGKEIVSRLGEERYQFAIKRVKELVSGE
jgi:tetratricopeptide (TPR) repeat protein